MMSKFNPIREALVHLPGNWVKGPMGPNGETCALGHLYTFGMEQSDDFSEYATARDLLIDVIQAEYPDRALSFGRNFVAVADFNDHPDTTEAEVIAVMELPPHAGHVPRERADVEVGAKCMSAIPPITFRFTSSGQGL